MAPGRIVGRVVGCLGLARLLGPLQSQLGLGVELEATGLGCLELEGVQERVAVAMRDLGRLLVSLECAVQVFVALQDAAK